MTDAEYEEVKGQLHQIINEWHPALGLGWWDISLEHVRDEGVFDGGDDEARRNPGCVARTQTQWEYLQATITFCMPRLHGRTYEDLEEIMLHELVHMFVGEMRDCMRCDCGVDKFDVKHEERVVTQLTKAFGSTRTHFEKPRANREAGPFEGGKDAA